MYKGKFETIHERLRKRLVGCSEQYMSSGKKEILIKLVAQAIPAYVMSVLKLPALVCDELTCMSIGGVLKEGRERWLG
jgi:hypothetical protein